MVRATKNGHVNRIADEFDAPPASANARVVIEPPRFETILVTIKGTSQFVQCRFSEEAAQQMRDKQALGSVARGKRGGKKPRNFDTDYKNALHLSTEGWHGIPASAFRSALISACRCGRIDLKMTQAKLSVFIDADGFDSVDGTPLVRIHGTPEKFEMPGMNANGQPDIRVRGRWTDWHLNLRITYDADMVDRDSVLNLLVRAGIQVGVGCGRPDSKKSAGLGWGTWRVLDESKNKKGKR